MLNTWQLERLRGVLRSGEARTLHELERVLHADGPQARAALAAQLAVWQAQGRLRRRNAGAHVYWQSRSDRHDTAPAADAVHGRWQSGRLQPLQQARSCYGHLAGALGVLQLQALRRERLIGPGEQPETWRFTAAGADWYAQRGMALAPRDQLVHVCLDWSERRDHLGGAAGRALLAHALRRRWLRSGSVARALECTPLGQREFLPWLQGSAPLPL